MPLVGNHFLKPAQLEALRPRVTFTLSHGWIVKRMDGVTQRFVSHDKWVRAGGQDYRPVGPNVSDLEQSEGAAESDFEIVGFLSADTIRASDIHAGRYDGATIEHSIFDWQRPWIWFRKHVWWIKDITEDGGLFKAQVQGVERFLTIAAGKKYERECHKVLGSLECGATPRTLFSVVVEAVGSIGSPILAMSRSTQAVRFTNASWTWSPAIRDGLLTQGKVVWTSGPNKGTSQLIGHHVGRELVLEEDAPFPIKAGDVASLFSGCNGSLAACTDDYDNRINFGGVFRMPSTEDQFRRPTEV